MSEEQDRNRNEWAQLTQDHYLRTAQQQTCIPEGYAPVQDRTPTQGYAPAEAQNGYSDYQQTTARPNDTDQSREVNAYMVDDDDIPVEEVCDFVTRQQKRKSKSQAKPKEEQPKSKRAERREKIASHYGGVSATDSPKGLAAWRDGIFQVCYPF